MNSEDDYVYIESNYKRGLVTQLCLSSKGQSFTVVGLLEGISSQSPSLRSSRGTHWPLRNACSQRILDWQTAGTGAPFSAHSAASGNEIKTNEDSLVGVIDVLYIIYLVDESSFLLSIGSPQ